MTESTITLHQWSGTHDALLRALMRHGEYAWVNRLFDADAVATGGEYYANVLHALSFMRHSQASFDDETRRLLTELIALTEQFSGLMLDTDDTIEIEGSNGQTFEIEAGRDMPGSLFDPDNMRFNDRRVLADHYGRIITRLNELGEREWARLLDRSAKGFSYGGILFGVASAIRWLRRSALIDDRVIRDEVSDIIASADGMTSANGIGGLDWQIHLLYLDWASSFYQLVDVLLSRLSSANRNEIAVKIARARESDKPLELLYGVYSSLEEIDSIAAPQSLLGDVARSARQELEAFFSKSRVSPAELEPAMMRSRVTYVDVYDSLQLLCQALWDVAKTGECIACAYFARVTQTHVGYYGRIEDMAPEALKGLPILGLVVPEDSEEHHQLRRRLAEMDATVASLRFARSIPTPKQIARWKQIELVP